MDVGLVTRVGLQLLLEPQSTAYLFNGASVAVGAVYPAYRAYKAVVVPRRDASSSPRAASLAALEAERLLKYCCLFGLTIAAERLVGEAQLERVPYYPHAKLLFLLWLQANHGHGASLLFEAHLAPWLARYERKIDALLECGAHAVEGVRAAYSGPINAVSSALAAGLAQLGAFLRWVSTPDDAPPGVGAADAKQQQRDAGSGGSVWGSGAGGGGGGAEQQCQQPVAVRSWHVVR